MASPVKQTTFAGLKTSQLGFGCMSLWGGFQPAGPASDYPNDQEVLAYALDHDITLFNTACFYGGGANETGISEVLKGRPRDSYVVATKFGATFGENKQLSTDTSPAGIRAQLELSLKQLGVDYLDLWILRGPFREEKTPLEDTMKEMKAIMAEGKVRHVGLSEIAPQDIRRAHAIQPITVLELEWSLFTRDCERDLVPTARELGIGFLAYSPLGRGLLTSTITKASDIAKDDARKHFSGYFSEENLEKNLQLVAKVKAIAERKGCTPGQLALAWLLAQGPDVVPIPGTKRIKYLEENIGAAGVKLTPQDLQELEAAIPHGAVSGDRYLNMKETSYHRGINAS